MNQKYFSLDKNYILKQAQSDYQIEFLTKMVEMVKEAYSSICNPLGLFDDTMERIDSTTEYKLEPIDFFYLKLAGIYRFKYGNDNQLEFIFNGPSHYENFKTQWEEKFYGWVKEFSQNPDFIKAILEIAIFYPENQKIHLSENKLNHFLNERFEVKIRKKRGKKAFKIA